MDRYKVFPSGEMGMHPAGNWTPYADAQATVEALQRERDEARRKYHEAMDIMSSWRNIDHAEAVARLLVSNKELVSLRQDYLVQQTQYVEATDRLAKELSALQVLVRAYCEAKVAFDDGRLREDHHAWKERFERLTTAEQALIASLDATSQQLLKPSDFLKISS